MATNMKLPVLVVVGPTASGKSGFALQIARKYGGELICADSRTVYKGMNIGTAKPSKEEQTEVPHWGLDLVNPNQRYTAADFQRYACEKIQEIQERGNLPIVVGGTGLYVDGVILGYNFPKEPSPEERQKLEKMSQDSLYKYCVKNNVKLPINDKNKRHLIRQLLSRNQNSSISWKVDANIIVVGITTEKEQLNTNIATRIEQMFENGVVEETILLGNKYGWNYEAMTGNIYQIVKMLYDKELNEQEAVMGANVRDRQLAKRQMTWFRRNPFILWGGVSELELYVSKRLDQRV